MTAIIKRYFFYRKSISRLPPAIAFKWAQDDINRDVKK